MISRGHREGKAISHMLDFSSKDKQSLTMAKCSFPDFISWQCQKGCLTTLAIMEMQARNEALSQARWDGCKSDKDKCWCEYGECGDPGTLLAGMLRGTATLGTD